MKKSLVILLLLTAFGLQAQGRFKEKKEQIKALKTAFISTELNLTPTEAEKFWDASVVLPRLSDHVWMSFMRSAEIC